MQKCCKINFEIISRCRIKGGGETLTATEKNSRQPQKGTDGIVALRINIKSPQNGGFLYFVTRK